MFSAESIRIPEKLIKIGRIFSDNGYKSYLVGGAVRDMLRGNPCHDYDIATDASPSQVMEIFRNVIPTGIAHGTVTIHIFGMEIETTTFRTETSYTDGRHPDKVEYAATIEEDLSRRDFTMNAIAAELSTGKITDPFGGQDDIQKNIIRTVGNPLDRFSEDGLRPVRAIRFSGQLGFRIEEKTFAAISEKEVLKKVAGISPERFRDEFCKILQTEKPSDSLRLLEQCGILQIFIPQFSVCRGCLQQDDRGFHEFDVADHILNTCDGAPRENLIVRLAAFFHDIGKPESRTVEMINGAERIHFHGHEQISAEKAKDSMTALKFSNSEIKTVSHLVREHMFHYESSWSDSAVRRFIIRAGTENLENLFLLRLADIYGMHAVPLQENSPSWNLLSELKTRIHNLLEEKSALSIKDMKVNGTQLIEAGIPAGKTMGKILRELFDTITEFPEKNEKETLISLAKKIFREKYSC
ncbi:CCA tRNA nucleotidyltransferase [Treponema sp.]|uniref:CCA tRNA nucleotidyltransferase n=1 Tax=Treponema sp. TaxID=166 RepID=UPI003F06AED6